MDKELADFFQGIFFVSNEIFSRISFWLKDWGVKVLFYQCCSFGHLSFYVFKLLLSLFMCTISIELGSCRNLNYMLNKFSGTYQFISKVITIDIYCKLVFFVFLDQLLHLTIISEINYVTTTIKVKGESLFIRYKKKTSIIYFLEIY